MAAAIVLSIVGFWVLVVTVRPLNWRRFGMLLAMAVTLAGCLTVPFVQNFLHFSLPTGDLLVVSIGVSTLGCLAIEIIFRVASPSRGAGLVGARDTHNS